MRRRRSARATAGPAALACALALSAVLAGGCGGDGGSETSSDAAAAVPATPTVPRTPEPPATSSRTPTGTTGATVAPSTTVPQRRTTIGIRPFAANSPWNTRVSGLAVATGSAAMVRRATQRLGVRDGRTLDTVRTELRESNSPLFVNTRGFTTPVVDSSSDGVPTKIVCRQINLPPPNNTCGDGWLVNELSIPADVSPQPQYDGWFTVLDRAKGVAYDLWRARRSADGGTISYQYLRRWDLSGPGFLAPGTPSGRGSGLPLFAGLILPEEIRAGKIDHALAISVPGPAGRRYVQPASVTDGNGATDSLPEGARLRLKSSVDVSRLLSTKAGTDPFGVARRPFPGNTNLRAARAILTALKTYGAIVVDRSAVPTLYAKLNARWAQPLRRADGALLQADGRHLVSKRELRRPNPGTPLLRGSEVQGLRLTDFEVVALPPVRLDPAPINGGTRAPAGVGGVAPQAVPGTDGVSAADATSGVGR